MNDEDILKKLQSYINAGNGLIGLLIYEGEYNQSGKGYQYNNRQYLKQVTRWIGISQNLLDLRFGKDFKYSLEFRNQTNDISLSIMKERVQLGTGVLEFIYEALKSGLTEDLFYERQIMVFESMLDQSYEFLKHGHRPASAIYGRIVLETTIREFAKKHGIEDEKFEQLIINLRKANVITKPMEGSLRANITIGNMSAHGDKKFDDISDKEIKEYLNFIRDKVLTL